MSVSTPSSGPRTPIQAATWRALAATNCILLGLNDSHFNPADARPKALAEDFLRVPALDVKRFEVVLHFLLSFLFPTDAELKACWPTAGDKARQREFQRVCFHKLEEVRGVPAQLRNKTVLQSTLFSDRHFQLLGYLSALAVRAVAEREAASAGAAMEPLGCTHERALALAASSAAAGAPAPSPGHVLTVLAQSLEVCFCCRHCNRSWPRNDRVR